MPIIYAGKRKEKNFKKNRIATKKIDKTTTNVKLNVERENVIFSLDVRYFNLRYFILKMKYRKFTIDISERQNKTTSLASFFGKLSSLK